MESLEFEGWLDHFSDLGVGVAGCSIDTLGDQLAFAAEHTLRYPLVADPTGEICRAYDVIPEGWILAGRKTVVIGSDGIVLLAYPDVALDAEGHAEQVLADVRILLS